MLTLLGDAQVIAYLFNKVPIVVANDLDDDGDSDVLASDSRGIHLYENDGRGNFGPGQLLYAADYARRSMAVDDVNGDGISDIVVPSFESEFPDLMWLEGPGNDDSWVVHAFGTPVLDGLPIIKTVDIDGDRDLDVLAYHMFGQLLSRYAKVLLHSLFRSGDSF